MPRRSLTLSIPQPCSENWAAMTPTAQGRHCAACDKVVVDFTRMTDAEVVAWLQKQSGKICGRVRADQLARPVFAPDYSPLWRKWLAAVMVALGLGKLMVGNAQAQTAVPHLTQYRASEISEDTASIVAASDENLTTSRYILRGIVVDSISHQPLPGVTILLRGTNVGVYTGPDGRFELYLRPVDTQQPPIVSVSTIGFQGHRFIPVDLAQDYRIELTPDNRLLGETVIIAGGISIVHPIYTPRGLWLRLSRPFRR